MSTAATATVCHETARPRPPHRSWPPVCHRGNLATTSRHTLPWPALATTLLTTLPPAAGGRVRDQEATLHQPSCSWCSAAMGCVAGGWCGEAGPGQSWDHVTTAASSTSPAASPMITHKYLHNTRQEPGALYEPSFSVSDSIQRLHTSCWAFISTGGTSESSNMQHTFTKCIDSICTNVLLQGTQYTGRNEWAACL